MYVILNSILIYWMLITVLLTCASAMGIYYLYHLVNYRVDVIQRKHAALRDCMPGPVGHG